MFRLIADFDSFTHILILTSNPLIVQHNTLQTYNYSVDDMNLNGIYLYNCHESQNEGGYARLMSGDGFTIPTQLVVYSPG